MIFAQATNGSLGSWVFAAALIVSGLSSLGGLVAFFATRREVQDIDRRLQITEASIVAIRQELKEDKEDLIANGERRSTSLHRRIDPMIDVLAGIKGGQEAFTISFNNFTSALNALVNKKS